MHNRREAREAVLRSLYAVEVGNNRTQDVTKHIIKVILKDDVKSIKFAENLMLKTVDFSEELDKIIDHHITNWDVHRLAILDKLIIRMALTELIYFEEVPVKVTINEAIELAKQYSTRKSGNFVNGILDAALGQLKKENKINKTGRGLIETSDH